MASRGADGLSSVATEPRSDDDEANRRQRSAAACASCVPLAPDALGEHVLHALRSRARDDREAGFTLIEILVAMVLMAIVMSSLAVFFIGAQRSSSALRLRQNATIVADQAMDHVHSLPVAKLVTNR